MASGMTVTHDVNVRNTNGDVVTLHAGDEIPKYGVDWLEQYSPELLAEWDGDQGKVL